MAEFCDFFKNGVRNCLDRALVVNFWGKFEKNSNVSFRSVAFEFRLLDGVKKPHCKGELSLFWGRSQEPDSLKVSEGLFVVLRSPRQGKPTA